MGKRVKQYEFEVNNTWDKKAERLLKKDNTGHKLAKWELPYQLRNWMKSQVNRITKKLCDEDVPDSFEVMIKFPTELKNCGQDRNWPSGYGCPAKYTNISMKDVYGDISSAFYGDQLRWHGLPESDRVYGTVQVFNSSVKTDDNTISIRYRRKKNVKVKTELSRFEFNEVKYIKSADTKIVSSESMDNPDATAQIEAIISSQCPSKGHNRMKYVVDTEKEVFVRCADGVVETFDNQDNYFKQLREDLGAE